MTAQKQQAHVADVSVVAKARPRVPFTILYIYGDGIPEVDVEVAAVSCNDGTEQTQCFMAQIYIQAVAKKTFTLYMKHNDQQMRGPANKAASHLK